MTRTFFAFALMAAASRVGTAAAAGAEARECADPLVCLLLATPEYDAQLRNMSRAVSNNWDLVAAPQDVVAAQQNALADGYTNTSGDDDNCLQRTTVVRPYRIQTHDSSTHHIVQLPHFEQKVKWTECVSNEPRRACFGSVIGDLESTEARCVVKYGAVSLYVYEPRRDELVYETFPVAVGCACRFKCNRL